MQKKYYKSTFIRKTLGKKIENTLIRGKFGKITKNHEKF
jgi:hypothetical protein